MSKEINNLWVLGSHELVIAEDYLESDKSLWWRTDQQR